MKTINVKFSGLDREIKYNEDYRMFIKEIKKTFNLKDEECSRLQFEFLCKTGGNDLQVKVTNAKEFELVSDLMPSVNSITSKMSILPKSQNSNFQNPIFENPIFENPNFEKRSNLDEKIMELETQKQALKKKIKALREENEMYERRERNQRINELNEIKNKENNKMQEALNRLEIMEKTESKINNNMNQKIEIKNSQIPNNIRIKNIENINKLDCEFLDKDKNSITLEVEKNKISAQNPIIYMFRVKNIGAEPWPNDTILKCEIDDSEIYFYYVSINDEDSESIVLVDGTAYQQFKIRVLFKNYSNIIPGGEYKLRSYLLSDKYGRIGKNYGNLIIRISKNDSEKKNEPSLKDNFHDDFNYNEDDNNFEKDFIDNY
jgi:hypothetical protein